MVKALFFFLFAASLVADDLEMQAFLESEEPWYPGQEGNVTYKIRYIGEIAILEEKLPLLDLPGLEKVGDKIFYEYEEYPYSVQEITQKYRAKRSGTFTAPESLIVGVHYSIEHGEKKVIPPKLSAKTAAYSITITPFPEEGKPNDFNGSIGKGSFELIPPQSSKARVGDWILFSLVAKDFDPKSLLIPPDLDCLPGFAGFFKAGPTVEADKNFTFKIAPENALPKEIPPILWSVFNPKEKKYHTFKTDPIPIELIDTPPPIPPKLSLKLTPKEILIPNIKLGISIPWIPLHLGLLSLIIGYLFLRKPIKKYRLLYRLNPLRQAEKMMDKEEDPQKIAQQMETLLARKLPQNADTLDFISTLQRFRFGKGVTLTKETIIKTGKSLYRSLMVLAVSQQEFNQALTTLLKSTPSKENYLQISYLFSEIDNEALAVYYQKQAEAFEIHSLVLACTFFAALFGFYLLIKRKKIAYPMIGGTYLFLALYTLLPLFTPREAIVLQPAYLQNSSLPLIPGDSVAIIGIENNQFRIYSPTLKTYGYVSQKNVRPLE